MKNATSKGYFKYQYIFNVLRVMFHVKREYDKATFSDRLSKNYSDRYNVIISSMISYLNQKYVCLTLSVVLKYKH